MCPRSLSLFLSVVFSETHPLALFRSAKTVGEEECKDGGGEERGGNDFEIFVAVHKFEGGGRAYLNTDRAFPASCSSSPVVLFLFVLFFLSAAARPRLVLPLLDLTSSLLSFLVFLLHLPLLLFGSRPPLSRER